MTFVLKKGSRCGKIKEKSVGKYIMLLKNAIMDEERALYGSENVTLENCVFDGPSDGESALKECRCVVARDCTFNLRYPLWHDAGVKLSGAVMTEFCRAALWYSTDIEILGSKLHGIKAVRECKGVKISDSDINSTEFGWFSNDITVESTHAMGEYMFLRSSDMRLCKFNMKGKYSFQYIENATFENCTLDTKDAFWHAKNVTVRNSVVRGEYLGWYAENLTFENCVIYGTQPLCYCKGLKLINCEMHECDLAFERSDVVAEITTPVVSIKNPLSGKITLPAVGEIITEDGFKKCEFEFV